MYLPRFVLFQLSFLICLEKLNNKTSHQQPLFIINLIIRLLQHFPLFLFLRQFTVLILDFSRDLPHIGAFVDLDSLWKKERFYVDLLELLFFNPVVLLPDQLWDGFKKLGRVKILVFFLRFRENNVLVFLRNVDEMEVFL